MADNLTQPLLIVNTQAQVAGQVTPAMSTSSTASYAANQSLNQTLVLRAGQTYAPNIGFSTLVINTTGPVQLLAALGSNPAFINQVVNQQTTIDTAADSFTVTNNGTTPVTVKMTIVVTPSAATPPVGVVTSLNSMIGNIDILAGSGIGVFSASQDITISNTGVLTVNGQSGTVTINAANLPGLSKVAQTGEYSDLIGAPAAYVLPVATASILGGIKVGSGLSITQDGTLSATGNTNLVTSVNTLQGAVTIQATDNGASGSQSLIVNSGATTGDIVLNRLAVSGSGLAINTANGVTTITSSGLQGAVLTVDGQRPDSNGNVVVQAVDNAAGTGTSLITDSGATTGSLKFKKLVAGNNVSVTPDVNGNIVISGTVNAYTLPVATNSILGGVKQGSGVAIAPDGTISVASSYVLPVSTASVLGGVKIGANVSVAQDGTISVAAPYVLPEASATTLGGIKVGANLNLDADGTLWANPPFTLVPATPTILGGVKIGANISYTSDGTISVAAPYSLPIASSTVLGGIKVGANLTIAGDGTLSAVPGSYILPKATTTTLGGIIVGANLSINAEGVLSSTANPYTLPVATASVLGGVKQGSGVSIAGDGTLSVAAYSLPVATPTILGGVKIGSNVTVTGDGTISVAAPYVLPTASATVLGGIKVGANLSIDGNGVLSAIQGTYTLPVATTTVLGGVKQGSNVTIAGDGTLSVAAPYVLPVATTTTLGGVIVGDNLTVDGNGRISGAAAYTLPTASATVLGGVMVGSGLAINAGVLSVTATAPVTSVSGQTGAVVVKAQSANPESGSISLIANSGATTGTITTHDLVAGSGVTIAPDGNGNLEISSSGLVSSVSGQTGAVTVQAIDNNTNTGLSLISDSGATTGTIKLLRIVAGANITMGADASGNIEINGAAPTTPYVLPVATASVLGGVKIGANVSVAGDGTISVAPEYTLPIATTTILGGVKQGSGVTIAADGTISANASGVSSVNGMQGAVTISVADLSTASGSTLIADSGATSGTAKLLRIVAGSNVSLSNDTNGNLEISAASGSVPIATASVLGGVKIGSNVTVAGDGTISVAAPYTLPVSSSTQLGGVKIGANISVDANGVISVAAPTSYTLPVATSTVLGGVKQGSGVTIAGDGTLSVSAAVTSVSGQTGAVVVQATNNNAATGTSLIVNSGSTTGNMTFKTLVAGTNVSFGSDANSNLVINGSAGNVTTVSGQSGAVVIQATNTSTATGTSLINNSGATTGNIQLKTIVAGIGMSLSLDGNNNLVLNSSLFPQYLSFSAAGNVGGSFLSLATITLTAAATANTSIGLLSTVISGSTPGSRVTFLNLSNFTMTVTAPGNNFQVGTTISSSVTIPSGEQMDATWTGTVFFTGTNI
jgi:hypothetical protein